MHCIQPSSTQTIFQTVLWKKRQTVNGSVVSRNEYEVNDHLDNNFSWFGGNILRIITKYLNAHLKINSYYFGSNGLSGLMKGLSIYGCNPRPSFSPISSFYQTLSTCTWWFFQNASLNHLSFKSGYFFHSRLLCFLIGS